MGGLGTVGGTWTGGAFLALDEGPRALTNIIAYVAAPWSAEGGDSATKEQRGEVRLTRQCSRPLHGPTLTEPPE